MAQPRYPAQFPLPLRDSFAYQVDMGVYRSAIPSGIPRQRRRYRHMPHYFSLDFAVPVADVWMWQTWISRYGFNWFELPLVNAATAGESLCSNYAIVRCVSNYEVSVISQHALNYHITVELAAGELSF